jgi:hypothetical protein
MPLPRLAFIGRLVGAASVVSLLVAGPAGSARAAERPLREAVRVEAGASCLEAEILVDQLRTWLHRETIDDRISVEVGGDPARPDVAWFVLRRPGQPATERRFDPAPIRCPDLHAALALAIALAIDASVLAELGVPPSTPRAPRSTEPPPAPVRAAPTARVEAAPALLLALGAPGAVGGGATLRLRFRLDERVDLQAGVLGTWSPTVAVGSGRASLALFGARLDACGRFARGKIGGRVCLGGVGGTVVARGRGFPGAGLAGTIPWIAAVAGGELSIRLTPTVALAMGLEGVVPFVRTVLTVVSEDRATVRATRALPPIGGILAIGPVFRFG